MNAFQPEGAYSDRRIGISDSPSVVEFRRNYGDIDSAVNDLLIPQKNTENAVRAFLSLVENELEKNDILFKTDGGCFASPLENSYRADLYMLFNNVVLARIGFFCKGRELHEIHTKQGSDLSPRSYPVDISAELRNPVELAYEFGLDTAKDSRGLTALTRPFRHLAEGQPYRFAFDESGNLNKSESQINRIHDHLNITVAQLLFAVRQLGIENRKPTFVGTDNVN